MNFPLIFYYLTVDRHRRRLELGKNDSEVPTFPVLSLNGSFTVC